MRILIPMAGIGKRMRPHTLTTPKPLLPVIGKPIVQLLLEDLVKMLDGKADEVGFIIGDFGAEAEKKLKDIAIGLGLKPSISLSNTDKIFLVASWVFPSLAVAKESISSRKSNEFPKRLQALKIFAKFLSASPYHLDIMLSIGT